MQPSDMGTQVAGPSCGDKHNADNTVQLEKLKDTFCVTFPISMKASSNNKVTDCHGLNANDINCIVLISFNTLVGLV